MDCLLFFSSPLFFFDSTLFLLDERVGVVSLLFFGGGFSISRKIEASLVKANCLFWYWVLLSWTAIQIQPLMILTLTWSEILCFCYGVRVLDSDTYKHNFNSTVRLIDVLATRSWWSRKSQVYFACWYFKFSINPKLHLYSSP